MKVSKQYIDFQYLNQSINSMSQHIWEVDETKLSEEQSMLICSWNGLWTLVIMTLVMRYGLGF